MKLLRHLLIGSLAGLCYLSTPVIAQAEVIPPTLAEIEELEEQIPARKKALIEQLLELTLTENQAQQVFDNLMAQMQQQFAQIFMPLEAEISSEERQLMEETFLRVTNRMTELMVEKIDFDQMNAQISTYLYHTYYTEAELEDIIAFYETETGQKTLTVLPEMTETSMLLVNEAIFPTLLEIQQQVLEEEFEALEEE